MKRQHSAKERKRIARVRREEIKDHQAVRKFSDALNRELDLRRVQMMALQNGLYERDEQIISHGQKLQRIAGGLQEITTALEE